MGRILRVIDEKLFHIINGVWSNRFFDAVMPLVTDLHQVRFFIFILVPLVLAAWIYRQRQKAIKVLLGRVLTIALSDSISHRVIKPFFHRARPQKAGIQVVMRTHPYSGYSFPSNHAANCFAGAFFLGSIYPILRLPLLAAAFLVAYSRVYVGMHFPFDVFGGAVLGWGLGWLVAALFRKRVSRKDSGSAV